MSAASTGAPAACSSAHPRITGPRSSSSATVTSTVLRGLPCALSRYTATADGLNSATATHRQPRRARLPCQVLPTVSYHAISVRGAADQVHAGEPRAEPTTGCRQNRCSRAGFDDPAGLEHEHPVGEGEHIEEVMSDQHRGATVTGQHQRHRHAEQQAQRSARPGGLAQHERRRRRLPGDQRPEVRLVHIGGDRDQRQHHEPRPNRRGHINPAGQHKSRPYGRLIELLSCRMRAAFLRLATVQ